MTNSDWPEAAVTASGQLHPWGEFLANRTGFTPVPGGFETPSLHEIHYRYCRAATRQYLPRMNRQAHMQAINSTPPSGVEGRGGSRTAPTGGVASGQPHPFRSL